MTRRGRVDGKSSFCLEPQECSLKQGSSRYLGIFNYFEKKMQHNINHNRFMRTYHPVRVLPPPPNYTNYITVHCVRNSEQRIESQHSRTPYAALMRMREKQNSLIYNSLQRYTTPLPRVSLPSAQRVPVNANFQPGTGCLSDGRFTATERPQIKALPRNSLLFRTPFLVSERDRIRPILSARSHYCVREGESTKTMSLKDQSTQNILLMDKSKIKEAEDLLKEKENMIRHLFNEIEEGDDVMLGISNAFYDIVDAKNELIELLTENEKEMEEMCSAEIVKNKEKVSKLKSGYNAELEMQDEEIRNIKLSIKDMELSYDEIESKLSAALFENSKLKLNKLEHIELQETIEKVICNKDEVELENLGLKCFINQHEITMERFKIQKKANEDFLNDEIIELNLTLSREQKARKEKEKELNKSKSETETFSSKLNIVLDDKRRLQKEFLDLKKQSNESKNESKNEINLLRFESRISETTINVLKGKLEIKNEEIEQLNDRMESAKTAQIRAERKLDEKEDALYAASGKIKYLECKLKNQEYKNENLQSEIEILDKKNDNKEKENSGARKEIRVVEKLILLFEDKLKTKNTEIDELNDEIECIRRTLIKEKIESSEKGDALDSASFKIRDLEFTLKNQEDRTKDLRFERLKKEFNSKEKESTELRSEKRKVEMSNLSFEKTVRVKDTQIEQLKEEMNKSELKRISAEKECRNNEKALIVAQAEITKLKYSLEHSVGSDKKAKHKISQYEITLKNKDDEEEKQARNETLKDRVIKTLREEIKQQRQKEYELTTQFKGKVLITSKPTIDLNKQKAVQEESAEKIKIMISEKKFLVSKMITLDDDGNIKEKKVFESQS